MFRHVLSFLKSFLVLVVLCSQKDVGTLAILKSTTVEETYKVVEIIAIMKTQIAKSSSQGYVAQSDYWGIITLAVN